MRKIILNLCTSLDSYIEGPNGEIDWCFTDQDYSMTDFLSRTDTILFGRKSFEQLETLMPGAFEDKKKIVFSRTLKQENTKAQVISVDIEEAILNLKKQEGKDIWLFGGAAFVTTLMKLNVVDQLMISVHPLILGTGMPLFTDLKERIQLKLTDQKSFTTGLVQLYYDIVH